MRCNSLADQLISSMWVVDKPNQVEHKRNATLSFKE